MICRQVHKPICNKEEEDDCPKKSALENHQWTTLHNISLSSRNLYSIAKPHLWKTIDTDWCDVVLLLRSVAEKPSLSSMITSLRLGALFYHYRTAYSLLQAIQPPERKLKFRLRDKFGLDCVLTEELLLRLKNLTHLRLLVDTPYDLGHPYDTAFEPKATLFSDSRFQVEELQPLLAKLSRLEIFELSESGRSSNILDWSRKLLQGQTTAYVECHTALLSMENALPDIRCLEIRCIFMDFEQFGDLIDKCPVLTSLTFHYDASEDVLPPEDDMGSGLTLRDAVAALTGRKDTLEELSLHFTTDTYTDDDDGQARLPDMRHFTKLVKLGIDHDALVRWVEGTTASMQASSKVLILAQKLPKTLTNLAIAMADGRIVKAVEELASCSVAAFPNLRTIELEFWDCLSKGREKRLDAATQKLKEQKVEVVVYGVY